MKHNYNNYSKPEVKSEPTPGAENTPAAVPPVTEEVVNAGPALTAEPAEPTATIDPEPEEETKQPVTGIVTANKLNVRKLPNTMGQVLTVVTTNTVLAIDPSGETSDWYKVITPAGVEGYCMKTFVEVK